MQDVIIRHSNAEDVPGIKAIFEGERACSGTLQMPYSSLALWEKRFKELPDGFYSLVAEKDGQIVGHIVFETFQNPRRKHVGSFGMAVKDAYQGKGIGSRLLSTVTDMADNWLNIKRIEITVFTDNEAAINLYKNNGFTIEGESAAYAFRQGEYVSVYHLGRVSQEFE